MNIVILNRKYMRWLHVFHIVSISVWLGAVVCILALTVICFGHLNTAEFLTVAPLIPELYRGVVLPAALLAIIQGILYGLYTNWGFFKFRWVTWKWCLVILTGLSTGIGGIGQIFLVVDRVEKVGYVAGWADGKLVLFYISLQIIFLLTIILLSVYKPAAKAQPQKQASA